MTDLKRCPFRLVGNPGGPFGAWECLGNYCAWWNASDEQCAIAVIAAMAVGQDDRIERQFECELEKS